MSGQHAYLPPSGAGAWRWCAKWPTMNQLYPQLGEKMEALQGEASHWAFAEILDDRSVAEGQIAPNNITLDEQMIEGAELFVEVVDEHPGSNWELVQQHVEERVDISVLHPECWGTPDTWQLFQDKGNGLALIRLPDYKFGHDYVEVFENWQLLTYLAGILKQCGLTDDVLLKMQGDIMVELIIVQPRSYHRDGVARRWKAKARNLVKYFDQLRGAAAAACEPNPVATPGDHCEHCPGRYACEALQKGAYRAADLSQRSAPLNLSIDAASLELRMLKHYKNLLDARVTGLEERIEDDLRSGKSAPFHALEPGQSRTVWKKSDGEVLALGQMYGKDLEKRSVITPTQAVKLGVDKNMVALYSHTPPGKQRLVENDGSKARKIFGF